MTHTPTPWFIANVHDMGGTRLEIINTHPRHGEPAPIAVIYETDEEGKANAEFIVRAANAHDDFVHLAECITQRYGEQINKGEEIEGAEIVDFLSQYLYPTAKAAIAKTQGGK